MSHVRFNSEGRGSSPASESKPAAKPDTTATGNADPEGSTSSASESSGVSAPINKDAPIPQSPKKDADGKPPADKSGGVDTDVLGEDKDSSGSDTEEEDDDDDVDDDSSESDIEEEDDDDDQLQRALSGGARNKLIKAKLVTQHRPGNGNNADESNDEGNYAVGQKESSKAGTADKFGDGLGYLGIASGIAGNISSFVDNDDAKKAAGITGMAGGAIGFVTSAIKSGTSMYRAGRTKSRYARKAANTKTASGALGMIGGLSGMAGSLLGLTNDGSEGADNSKKATIAQGGFGVLKGVMDAIGSGLDFKASSDEKKAHGDIVGNASTISSGSSHQNPNAPRRDLDQELEDVRDQIAQQKQANDRSSQSAKAARKRRHTLKARKYAMKQAADMHSARAGESRKNVGNLVGGIFGGLGGVLSGLSKILDPGGGLLGSVLKYIGAGSSLIGNLSKGIGKAVDKNRASNESEALKGNKQNVVDEYINDKAARIVEESKHVELTNREKSQYHIRKFPVVTIDEAKKVAVLRLGIDNSSISFDDSDSDELGENLTPDDYERAFKIITEKRAKNILKSEGADKNEMLDALGLDHDASLEDVVSSLSGNIS